MRAEKSEIATRAKMLKFEGETSQVRRLAEDVLTLLGRLDEAEATIAAVRKEVASDNDRRMSLLIIGALVCEDQTEGAWDEIRKQVRG